MDEVAEAAQLPTSPGAELLVVDRRGWVTGNVRTLSGVFGDIDIPLSGPQAKLVAWEGGAFLGLVARAVLAQYDPFRDCLIVVHPNLGDMATDEGLRWLLFHEVTHLAQFRGAPWIADHIVGVGKEVMKAPGQSWAQELPRRLIAQLPELVAWVRGILEGDEKAAASTPLLDLLPPEHKDRVLHLNSLLTLLEGHATLVTDVIAGRVLPNHEDLEKMLAKRRKRPPLLRLVEALAGLEMKRQQYLTGRAFCAAVWERGGAEALAPVWTGPEAVPTPEELADPDSWLRRVSG